MSHPDETTLLALRDGEPVDQHLRAHVDTCVPCRSALMEARGRAKAVEALLGSLDRSSEPDVAEAKARVRNRLDARWAGERRRADRTRHLRRAAVLLLVTAGAAWALPGSPVRSWLGLAPPAAPSAHDAVPVAPEAATGTDEGIVLISAADGIAIELDGVPAGSRVEMVWLPGATARLSAGPGARYSVAAGTARAHAPEGPVRIGIPVSAPVISIRINGRMVFQGTAEQAAVADVASRSETGIVFSVPEP